MSDEPQPLRLKPRAPPGADAPAPPAASPPPAGGDQGDAARLRLKPRLTLAEDPGRQPPAELPPPAAPAPVVAPEGFKLRPKNVLSAPPVAPAPVPAELPPPAPPPGLPTFNIPPPPRPGTTMPPMSVLAPPPAPGAPADAPAGPKLSLGAIAPPGAPPVPGKPGLNIKLAGDAPKKIGGKTVVKPAPGKGPVPSPAGGPRKKPGLGILPKVGIAVLVVAVAIGGIFTYRIFFPPPVKEVIIKAPSAQRGPSPADVAKAQAAAAKAAADAAAVSIRLAEEKAHKAAAAAAEAPTPTPTSDAQESVMVATDLTSDVKVNSTHLDAAPAASSAFRAYVASAMIGGVFQGHPARALINGAIVREGQVVEEPLGIAFERIDVDKKTITFRDATGAEVSKNY